MATYSDIQRPIARLDVDDRTAWSRALVGTGPSPDALARLEAVHVAVRPLLDALRGSPLIAPRWGEAIGCLLASIEEVTRSAVSDS